MNSKTVWAGILAFSVATLAWGQAAPPPGGQAGGPGGGHPGMMVGGGGAGGRMMAARLNPYDQMVEELNLTDDQKPKLKELCDAQEKTLRDLQKQAADKMRAALDNRSRSLQYSHLRLALGVRRWYKMEHGTQLH